LDNAQRVKENGFGLTLNLYTCNKETLIGSVNTFLDDFSLVRTMSTISYRMQNSETIKKGFNSYWKYLTQWIILKI
jgi:UDP:flavonoid glycosyltransferase YjiC (YdhE family)